MPRKRKPRVNKTIGFGSESLNRELLLGASEDDDYDDADDCLDCYAQPACLNIDSVNRLLSDAAAADEIDEKAWRDTEIGEQYDERTKC